MFSPLGLTLEAPLMIPNWWTKLFTVLYVYVFGLGRGACGF